MVFLAFKVRDASPVDALHRRAFLRSAAESFLAWRVCFAERRAESAEPLVFVQLEPLLPAFWNWVALLFTGFSFVFFGFNPPAWAFIILVACLLPNFVFLPAFHAWLIERGLRKCWAGEISRLSRDEGLKRLMEEG